MFRDVLKLFFVCKFKWLMKRISSYREYRYLHFLGLISFDANRRGKRTCRTEAKIAWISLMWIHSDHDETYIYLICTNLGCARTPWLIISKCTKISTSRCDSSGDFQSIQFAKGLRRFRLFFIRTRNIRDIYIYISFTKFSFLKDKIYVLNIDKRYWRE